MRVKVANRLLEAYPVENCIYEVSYCGKKEFYQDLWDAVRSKFYLDSSCNATITKILVRPMSDKRVKERILSQKWGIEEPKPLCSPKELKQSKFYRVRVQIRKNLSLAIPLSFIAIGSTLIIIAIHSVFTLLE